MLPAMRLQRVGHDFAMTPWTVAHQVPLFMESSRQEYWSKLPFPTPADLLIRGSNPHLLGVSGIGRQILYR